MARERLMSELWGFMRVHKKLWMLPLLLAILGIGIVVIAVQGSALAPFIYTLF